jgi:hypothetical protein
MCMRRNNKYIHNFDAETDGKLSFTRPAKLNLSYLSVRGCADMNTILLC